MGKQTSIQLDEATQRQVSDLTAAGFGKLTSIVRTAIDRMHRQECAHRQHVEVWLSQDGTRYAVLVRAGRAHAAAGPLTGADVQAIQGRGHRPAWSIDLADSINLAQETQGVYRRIWSEREGGA
jgi:predicted transcriptional regulator